MSSAVDIANQALLMLGAKPVISFDDDTPEAAALKTLYTPTKRMLLRMYDWNCSIRTVTVARLNEDHLNWDFVHAIPDNCLRVIEVINQSNYGFRSEDWDIEGKKILSNNAEPIIRGTFVISEPEMDSHVERALVMAVARDLAYAITADNAREGSMDALFEKALMEARTTDAQERSHKVIRIDKLDALRHR